jgi:hypothetical protein
MVLQGCGRVLGGLGVLRDRSCGCRSWGLVMLSTVRAMIVEYYKTKN